MKYWLGILCIAFALVAGSNAALAEIPGAKPLMVIRFNQQNVPYEQPLYNTVAQALEVKPSVMFDVISVSPRSNDAITQMRNDQMASTNTGKVLATLQQMGVPKSRITLSNAHDDIKGSEVLIFVR